MYLPKILLEDSSFTKLFTAPLASISFSWAKLLDCFFLIRWALLLENTIKYTKSCRIYHQISKYPPSFKYNSLFLPCKIIDGRVVTLTKCSYHICATAGVDPEKCILDWAGSLVIFHFIKCLNELPATCLYMRDPMDILCKNCHIVEVTGLEIQV